MFSTGHFIWMGISTAMVTAGLFLCYEKRPGLDRMLTICLVIGVASEVAKILYETQIVPVVVPVVTSAGLEYQATGAFAPYLKLEHLPLELCSMQILFILIARILKDGVWRRRLLGFMFVTCILGAGIAVVLSSIAPEFATTKDFLTSPRAWQFFIYHSMLIVLGIYLAFCPESGIRFRHLGSSLIGLFLLDFTSFYTNSISTEPVYRGMKLQGVSYHLNYFSSYDDPLGIYMTTKEQWLIYLAVRLLIAATLVVLCYMPFYFKEKRKTNESATEES